jgi:hypothetical protein
LKKKSFLVFLVTVVWVAVGIGWPAGEGKIRVIRPEDACAGSLSVNLTGRWKCNDGGTYYIHQVGTKVWWYGESGDNGGSWTNVFQGEVEGDRVRGKWVDVPHGRAMNSGEMTLQIQAPSRLVASQKTGGFGGSEWSR